MFLSVLIPTHNPQPDRLRRTLAGLRAQTLSPAAWETILVDNASVPPVALADYGGVAPPNARRVPEPQLGLSAARRRGFAEARGDYLVMVDDDNVLAPDYLAEVGRIFAAQPQLGAIGGPSRPEYETAPPAWLREFEGLLACRDFGPAVQLASGLWNEPHERNEYPPGAPIGAGMALRRSALDAWLNEPTATRLSDRRGGELSSGGDNDIVLALLEQGWAVGYFPTLAVTHLIPSARTTRSYLARLNRGIAKSWVQVLTKHQACPWGPIPGWTVPLRQIKAWFVYRAWSGPAAYIRWRGACGHFEGRASLAGFPARAGKPSRTGSSHSPP